MADRVIITGFMGSGKTAVASKLSRKMGLEFIDTDQMAEDRMGISISDAFTHRGESYFRDIEAEAVREALEAAVGERGRVISLGGGAVVTESVSRLLANEPSVIWLDADVDTAFSRAQGGGRPLARDRAEFERLYRQRRGYYEAVAGVRIDTSDRTVDEVVDAITSLMERRQP